MSVKGSQQPDEMNRSSRICIIEALDLLHDRVQVEHGFVEMKNFDFFDMPIRKAYIITSRNDFDSASDKEMHQTS